MAKRYIGCEVWYYVLPSESKRWVELSSYTGNRSEDEGFARYHIRKKHGLKKLPRGTRVWPRSDGE